MLYSMSHESTDIELKFYPNKFRSLNFARSKHDFHYFKLGIESISSINEDDNEAYSGIPLELKFLLSLLTNFQRS